MKKKVHTAPKSETPCRFFGSKGWCRYGDKCRFKHGAVEKDHGANSIKIKKGAKSPSRHSAAPTPCAADQEELQAVAGIDPVVWQSMPQELKRKIIEETCPPRPPFPVKCPKGVDEAIWDAMPRELRNKIVEEVRNKVPSNSTARKKGETSLPTTSRAKSPEWSGPFTKPRRVLMFSEKTFIAADPVRPEISVCITRGPDSRVVKFYDADSGKFISSLPLPAIGGPMAYDPMNGSLLVLLHNKGQICYYRRQGSKWVSDGLVVELSEEISTSVVSMSVSRNSEFSGILLRLGPNPFGFPSFVAYTPKGIVQLPDVFESFADVQTVSDTDTVILCTKNQVFCRKNSITEEVNFCSQLNQGGRPESVHAGVLLNGWVFLIATWHGGMVTACLVSVADNVCRVTNQSMLEPPANCTIHSVESIHVGFGNKVYVQVQTDCSDDMSSVLCVTREWSDNTPFDQMVGDFVLCESPPPPAPEKSTPKSNFFNETDDLNTKLPTLGGGPRPVEQTGSTFSSAFGFGRGNGLFPPAAPNTGGGTTSDFLQQFNSVDEPPKGDIFGSFLKQGQEQQVEERAPPLGSSSGSIDNSKPKCPPPGFSMPLPVNSNAGNLSLPGNAVQSSPPAEHSFRNEPPVMNFGPDGPPLESPVPKTILTVTTSWSSKLFGQNAVEKPQPPPAPAVNKRVLPPKGAVTLPNQGESVLSSRSEETDDGCPICFDSMNDPSKLLVIDLCGHCFHAKCITAWHTSDKAQRNQCPMCFSPILAGMYVPKTAPGSARVVPEPEMKPTHKKESIDMQQPKQPVQHHGQVAANFKTEEKDICSAGASKVPTAPVAAKKTAQAVAKKAATQPVAKRVVTKGVARKAATPPAPAITMQPDAKKAPPAKKSAAKKPPAKKVESSSESESSSSEDENSPQELAEKAKKKGDGHARRKQWKQAVSCYEEAVSLQDKNCVYRNLLGDAFLRVGQPDKALTQYQKSLRLDNGVFRTHVGLGRVYLEMGKIKDSVAAFDQALKINPLGYEAFSKDKKEADFVMQRITRAHKAVEQKNWKQANAMLSEGLKRSPKCPDLLKFVSTVCHNLEKQNRLHSLGKKKSQLENMIKKNKLDEARELVMELRVTTGDSDFEVLFLKGMIDFSTDTLDLAVGYMQLSMNEKSWEISPNHTEVFEHVLAIQRLRDKCFDELERKNYQSAYETAHQLIQTGKNHTLVPNPELLCYVYCCAGRALIMVDRLEEAINEFQLAIERCKTFGEAYVQKINVCLTLGSEKAVRNALETSRAGLRNVTGRKYKKQLYVLEMEALDTLRDMRQRNKVEKKKDYYVILGLERREESTPHEIKRAYKQAALRTHPDRKLGEDNEAIKLAEEEFKEIVEAYQVLSDPEKKRSYDEGDGFETELGEKFEEQFEMMFRKFVASQFGGADGSVPFFFDFQHDECSCPKCGGLYNDEDAY